MYKQGDTSYKGIELFPLTDIHDVKPNRIYFTHRCGPIATVPRHRVEFYAPYMWGSIEDYKYRVEISISVERTLPYAYQDDYDFIIVNTTTIHTGNFALFKTEEERTAALLTYPNLFMNSKLINA